MNGFTVAAIICGAAALIAAVVLAVVNARLRTRIDALEIDCDEFEETLAALRERHQHEILAIGQRVLETDKLVRRFGERLDAAESHNASAQPQYGQLQRVLEQADASGAETSAAEVELMSLLNRNRNHKVSG